MKCRSCNAQIRWVRTLAGKSMPVEEEPVYYLVERREETFLTPQGKVERGIRCQRTDDDARMGFIPHWGNCPGAKRHRRR